MAINPKKHEMPTQDPQVRAHNFNEVALGYTAEIAVDEASRCLNCKNKPCVAGCPVNINIPGFIDYVKKNDFEGAYRVISQSSSLPAVCVPPGIPVRKQVHPGHQVRARGHRPSGTLRGRLAQ